MLDDKDRIFTNIYGIGPSYLEVNSVFPQRGRFFTPEDESRRRLVCTVGPDVLEELEMPEDSIGEFIRLGGDWCKIVGVMEKRGGLLEFWQDDDIVMTEAMAGRLIIDSRADRV